MAGWRLLQPRAEGSWGSPIGAPPVLGQGHARNVSFIARPSRPSSGAPGKRSVWLTLSQSSSAGPDCAHPRLPGGEHSAASEGTYVILVSLPVSLVPLTCTDLQVLPGVTLLWPAGLCGPMTTSSGFPA